MATKIYLDHNATTPLHPEAKSVIMELNQIPLNASSQHQYGRSAKALLEDARNIIKSSFHINDNSYKVIFTSSGTESNNLVMGSFEEILISSVEHLSIYKYYHGNHSSRNIRLIKVDNNGIINFETLENLLKDISLSSKKPFLVSVIFANNETGIIQDIKKIADLTHRYGGILHSDAVQAFTKIDINLAELGIDYITISGHKIGAPHAVGALIMKEDLPLNAQIIGGGQERGLRAGTENVASISAFARVAKILMQDRLEHENYVKGMRDYLENSIKELCPEAKIIGSKSPRIYNTSSILMPGVDAQIQMIEFDLNGFAVSAGSACSSGSLSDSHVLEAMNVQDANSVIRVSLSYNNKLFEIKKFIFLWYNIYKKQNHTYNSRN